MLDKLKSMDKKSIWGKVFIIVGILLVVFMTYYFRQVLSAQYQIHIDTYFFKASSVFCLIVILLRRIDYKNWRLYAGTTGYIGYAVYYLVTHNNDYGPEYRDFLIWRFVLRCLILVIVLDAFSKKETTYLEKKNLGYSIIFIVAMVFCTALHSEAMLHVLFPAMVMFITPISEENWKRFLVCFSCGYYSFFLVSMVKSLVEKPQMYGLRYYFGNFGTAYGAGVLTMGGLISALYLFDMIKEKGKKVLLVVSILTLVFPCIMIFMIGSRSIQLASIVVVFLYFFMYEGKTEKENALRKRIILIVLGGMILFILLVSLFLFLLNISDETAELSFIGNDIIRNKLSYYVMRINGLRDTKSYGVVFEDGDKINILDHFLAERISIWYMYMKQMSLWGNSVLIPVDGYGPHSIYVYWLVKYGWIGGSLLIISAFAGVILAGRRLKTNRKVYLIPFLWIVYFLVAGIGESPFLEFDIAVFFIVFQYPLLFCMKKDIEKT